jgi:hypothetical protein
MTRGTRPDDYSQHASEPDPDSILDLEIGEDIEFQDYRIILRSLFILEEAIGLSDSRLKTIAQVLRDKRIAQVGVRHYLHEILNTHGSWDAKHFTLWYGDEGVRPNNGWGDDKIVDVLCSWYHSDIGLPDKLSFTRYDGQERTFYI